MLLLAVSAAAIFGAGLSLGEQSAGRDDAERAAVEAFRETYRSISHDFVGETDSDELVEAAIRGMFGTLDDPYSAYMAPDQFDSTLARISGEFEGIGARVGTLDPTGLSCEPIDADCRLVVTEVLPDSPALEAGLREDDVVRAVDDRSLHGQTAVDAVMLIRGPRGSDVTLTLDRGGTEEVLTIVRDVILDQDVRSAVLADGQIGYLRIDRISGRAADDLEAALRDLLDDGIERLVIDVRDDPGGFVDAAVEVTSQFLAGGPVFWEETAAGAQRAVEVLPGGLATDPAIALVVLVDDGSASASEILAGALQDAGRALLVGQPTFGKGTIQEWTQLPGDNGGFRLSVAKWLTRDKTWIDGAGLTPDVLVGPAGQRFRPDLDDDPGDDAQLARAIAVLMGDGSEDRASGPTDASPSDASPSDASPGASNSPAT